MANRKPNDCQAPPQTHSKSSEVIQTISTLDPKRIKVSQHLHHNKTTIKSSNNSLKVTLLRLRLPLIRIIRAMQEGQILCPQCQISQGQRQVTTQRRKSQHSNSSRLNNKSLSVGQQGPALGPQTSTQSREATHLRQIRDNSNFLTIRVRKTMLKKTNQIKEILRMKTTKMKFTMSPSLMRSWMMTMRTMMKKC